MTKFYKNGCTLEIKDNSSLTEKNIKNLEEIVLELVDVLALAIGASSAPRHNNPDREEFKHLRQKWFGKQRGTVRHTFRDIEDFLQNGSNTLTIVTHGNKCESGAHAYTPDGQTTSRREIYLCDCFFNDSVTGQISTIVHELTHLIRITSDFDPSSDEDINFLSTQDQISTSKESITQKKKAFFQNDLNAKLQAKSAYNFEYFVTDLINEAYEGGLPDACRR